MRIGFAGTPEFSALILKHLIRHNYTITLVITGADKKVGRGKKLTSNPVKNCADEWGIPTYQPVTMQSSEALDYIRLANLDILIVVAYGHILPTQILHLPTYGCLNIHTSLLPRWRGAAPVERAIQAGDTLSGVSIMQMNEGLDTGDILYTKQCTISPTETAQSLYEKLTPLAQYAITYTLDNLITLTPTAQYGEPTYAPKLTKAEGRIDWDEDATIIYNNIRAFNPYPIAYTTINEGKILRIIKAQLVRETIPHIIQTKTQLIIPATNGSIAVKKVQLAGKKVLNIQDFNRGMKVSLVT